MSEKIIVQVYMDKKLREFIKKAAITEDRTLSSYIRIKMAAVASKRLGIEYKE